MDQICPVLGCDYASNIRHFDKEVRRPLNLRTTRSHENEDAHRDMDGFDVDEELSRLRRAVKEVQSGATSEGDPEIYRFITEAFRNIDEHLRREGDLPMAWRAAASQTDL